MYDNTIEVVESKNWKLEIHPDDSPESPREWDNLGTMVCWHSRYGLGDNHDYKEPDDFLDAMTDEEANERWWDREYRKRGIQGLNSNPYFEAYNELVKDFRQFKIDKLDKKLIILPLYLFDHSGITISTSNRDFKAFDSAGWDWGQVGFIYTEKAEVLKEYGWRKWTKARVEKIENHLRSEVEVYDQYLQGDIYGFVLTKRLPCGHWDEEDYNSCWGFYGSNWKTNGMREHLDKEAITELLETEN